MTDTYPENDPRHHTARLKALLEQTARHARENILKITDPRGQALFETTVEVLTGLRTAYEHYEERSEPAWQQKST